MTALPADHPMVEALLRSRALTAAMAFSVPLEAQAECRALIVADLLTAMSPADVPAPVREQIEAEVREKVAAEIEALAEANTWLGMSDYAGAAKGGMLAAARVARGEGGRG